MKKRLSLVANFFAFNLLFFALYLNFVKEDNQAVSVYREVPTTLVNETVLLQDEAPVEMKLEKKNEAQKTTAQRNQKETGSSAPLALSFY